MDTVLRKPQAINQSPSKEKNPIFSPSGDRILYTSTGLEENHIWHEQRKNLDQSWWKND